MHDLGQFVVEADAPETGGDGAYLWDGQTAPQYLGAFSPDKLSNNGRVVGDTPWSPDGPPRTGVVWDSASGLREIPPLPGGSWTETRAINNLGQIVGICDTDVPWVGHPVGGSFRGPPDVQQHAFVWDENGGTIDLGTLGGDDCWGSGINDLGQVAGTSYTGNGAEYRAFLWDPVEGMRDLGPAPGDGSSRAGDINNAGQVIGEYRDRAAIWDPVHGVQEILDLIPPDTGWTYFVPYDINDAGQIAGYRIISWGFDPETGEYEYYDRRAVLLTPVPEPVGLSIWGASLGALVTLKRRRAGSRTHP